MLSSFTLTDLLLVLLVVLLGATLLVLLLRRGRSPAGEDLGARIDRLQVDTVQRVMERLSEQERHVREALDQRLGAFQTQLGERLDKGQAETSKTVTDLRERLVRIDEAQKTMGLLSSQVLSLQEVLSNKQARGAFGEVQLNDLVVAILPPSAYAFQVSLSNAARADCLLQLPNPPGPIAIDAKFPLESYRALHAATDETQRIVAARAFRQAVGKHIADIAGKYILAGETAESALMFLPSEAVYAELHTNFLDVVEISYRARVYIVSPTTLMATLNTVRAVLKDVKMREQAGLIQKEVGLLLGDVDRLGERVDSLRRHFGQAGADIEKIVTSAGKITGRGEKIQLVELQDGAQPSLLPPG